MSYKITDNSISFQGNVLQKANIFLREIAEQIVDIAEVRTPKDKGNLRRDVLKSVLGLSGKVRWQKDYAVYQEEKQFRNYTTPGTGPHFAREAVAQVVKRTEQIAKRVGLI